jgi:hypothetical protein
MIKRIAQLCVLGGALLSTLVLGIPRPAASGEPPDDIPEVEEATIDGSVRGIAFADLDANGKFDPGAGEYPLGWAYFKLASITSEFFLCGYVGPDGTFGLPLQDGDYALMPIGAPGWRVTTPYIQAELTDALDSPGYHPNYMGFVEDPNAPLETCDQYNPQRVASSDESVSSDE